MAGRYPEPNRLKIDRGSERRHLRNTPEPKAALPDPPDWLSTEAQTAWREIAPELYGFGLLTELDTTMFAVLCQTLANWRRAERFIAENGETYTGSGGLEKRHPMSSVASEAAKLLLTLSQQFGLTPLSRQRLDVIAPSGGDDFDNFLNDSRRGG